VFLGEPAQEFDAVDSRHGEIEDDRIGWVFFERIHEIRRPIQGADFE